MYSLVCVREDCRSLKDETYTPPPPNIKGNENNRSLRTIGD